MNCHSFLVAGLLSTAVSLLCIRPASAHHNFGVFYDSSRVITVSGIVTRYDYRMPHIEIDIQEQGESATKTWKIETLNARLAATYDLLRDSLQVGDPVEVEVEGWPARDGSDTLGGHQIVMPDGHVFVLRRSPRESPTRFRSIHGFTGDTKSPTPRDVASGMIHSGIAPSDPPSPPSNLSVIPAEVMSKDQPGEQYHEEVTVDDPQLEFIEQMEEESFAVASLKQLLEQGRSPGGQLAEIENLQVAMFNAKVLVPLISPSENAIKHFGGNEQRARDEMKKSLIKSIRMMLTIEEQLVARDEKTASQTLKLMLEHQHAMHLIFQ